jgi:hypothetical protein
VCACQNGETRGSRRHGRGQRRPRRGGLGVRQSAGEVVPHQGDGDPVSGQREKHFSDRD